MFAAFIRQWSVDHVLWIVVGGAAWLHLLFADI